MRFALPFLFLTLVGSAAPLQRTTIAEGFHDPMSIAVAGDGDVYLVEREGRLFRIRPDTGGVFQIGSLAVSALRATDPKSNSAVEDGLHGIALDPGFAQNQRLYLFYSVPTDLIDRLSRFTLKDGLLDLASEQKLIDIPVQRHDRICHHGGSVQFGPDGLLYLSVGDNTNPFESQGSGPIDDRPDRGPWDAQRSSGNTDDLRGKILRIRPTEAGYDVPPGNLFAPGTPKTRPEIYVMGNRNPFRISIDSKNSTLYWGEVGPDAAEPSPRGPAGHDEINQARKAGNFGWPFLVADNKPYPIYDFAADKPGTLTDPAAPRNPGHRNTGLTILPPGQPAFIWYPYTPSKEFPVMGKGGRNAMAGPVFYHDTARKYNILTKEDDHTLLTYDWIRGGIWKAKLGPEEKLVSLTALDTGFQHPMDMEMAADGSLWLLDYGSDWWFNKNGYLTRLLPPDGNRSPVLTIVPGPDRTYAVGQLSDPDNDPVSVTWWATIGATETQLGTGRTVTLPADCQATEIRAVASDSKSPPTAARISLVKETLAPELTLKLLENAMAYRFGDTLNFQVSAPTTPPTAGLTVRARYIPATGHDAGGPQFSREINSLVTANQCLACHHVDSPSVGPRYLDVALKYRTRPDALPYLKSKLKAGGAGVWGEIPMPAQIGIRDEDADTVIRAILGLAEGITESKGALVGELQLAAQPSSAIPGGAWEFTAEAPGHTAARFRIPAK